MARMIKEIGRNRDLPQLEAVNVAAAAAGSAADFESILTVLPNLSQGSPAGTSLLGGSNNRMTVRWLILAMSANLTGAATNNFTLQVNQYRAGAILVNTTSATTISAGANVTVTPASMANIFVGTQLIFSAGTGATETVTVLSVTGTTFNATFANGHSGAYTITSAPLMTITYASGVNEAKWVPHQFAVPVNQVVGGDVLTIQRVSSNATGLASPAFLVELDWISAGPQ